jgi:NitT/TauT family transport system permease protein
MKRSPVFFFLGILLLLAAWHLAASAFSGLVVASPRDTIEAALALLSNGEFWFSHLAVSLRRMGLALCVCVLAGGILGLLGGIFHQVRALVEPVRWMLATVPGVVVVVVFMLWFGMGDLMVISIAASMGAPVIFINLADAMGRADENLLAMAKVYRLSFRAKLVKIYAMAATGPFFSALVIAGGSIVRVSVLAEVLGAGQGVGYCLAVARSRLDTPELYALALISMGVAAGAEAFIFRPLERHMTDRAQK